MKQNEIARQYAAEEIEYEGKWYSEEISRVIQLFSAKDKSGKDYVSLESVSEYPNCILSGWTWNRVFGGILVKDAIRKEIIHFYEHDYSSYKEQLCNGTYETDKPIWVVIHAEELEPNTVYPVITDLKDSDRVIVLAINEII